MKKNSKKSLVSKLHRPLVLVSLICFLGIGVFSYLIIDALVNDSIKSPLGAIKTVSQTILEKPEQSKKLLDKGIERIEEMLSDLVKKDEIDVAKLKETDITEFFCEVYEELSMFYQSHKNIDILFELPLKKSIQYLKLDQELVTRSLRNLFKNSVEVLGDQKGKIVFRMEDTGSKIILSVFDSGPGIPKNLVDQIGKSDLSSTKTDGSGLGLYQVRKTMDLHGGNLDFNIEKGTTVRMIFPYKS